MNTLNRNTLRNIVQKISQVVCSPDNEIHYVSVMWPGAVHDSRIFKESALRVTLEQGKYVYKKNF